MLFLLVAAAAPSAVQTAPHHPSVLSATPTVREAEIDPERLALAREVVQAFLPPGFSAKMISSMRDARSGMMSEMFRTTPKDLGAKDGKDSDKSLGDMMRERDPNLEERMAITNRVMMEEMGKIMLGFEPELRDTMAKMYARRLTKTELTDLAAFLRTTSGKSFASQLMSMMSDPEYQQSVKQLAPKIMQAMPGIMEKVKKATANLPRPKEDGDAKAAELPST